MKAIRFAQPNPDSALSSGLLALIAVASSVSRVRNFLSTSFLRSPLSAALARDAIWANEIEASERRGGSRRTGATVSRNLTCDERSAIVSLDISRESNRTRVRASSRACRAGNVLSNARTHVTRSTHSVHIITDTLEKINATCARARARPPACSVKGRRLKTDPVTL